MQLNTVLPLLAILICPIVMGIMMWRMNKNMDNKQTHMKSDDSARDDHIKRKEE